MYRLSISYDSTENISYWHSIGNAKARALLDSNSEIVWVPLGNDDAFWTATSVNGDYEVFFTLEKIRFSDEP